MSRQFISMVQTANYFAFEFNFYFLCHVNILKQFGMPSVGKNWFYNFWWQKIFDIFAKNLMLRNFNKMTVSQIYFPYFMDKLHFPTSDTTPTDLSPFKYVKYSYAKLTSPYLQCGKISQRGKCC